MKLLEIYNLLKERYGNQNWWPIVENGECLYKEEFLRRERTEKEIFEIIVGAILTQNTQWKNVVITIDNLKREGLFSLNKILSTETEKIADLIRPSGYYNQKAKKLKAISELIMREGGIMALKKLGVQEARKKLLSVWGVGFETADSILLYGFNFLIFVIDAYTRRIFSRLGFISEDSDYEKIRIYFQENLPHNTEIYKEYHALIVEFGKEICTKKPRCEKCFLAYNFCTLHKNAHSFAQFIQQNCPETQDQKY
ncbi:MAG: endonuclease III domain-containing protein [Brevinematia bacterium]